MAVVYNYIHPWINSNKGRERPIIFFFWGGGQGAPRVRGLVLLGRWWPDDRQPAVAGMTARVAAVRRDNLTSGLNFIMTPKVAYR